MRPNILDTARSFLYPRQPGFLIFYVTNRCNFRCDFCFYYAEIEKGRKANELTLEQIETITQNIGPLLQLSLTGGEPFVRRDFCDLTELFLKNTKARYITIPSNGWFTDRTIDYFERILPQYPNHYFRLALSVDGIGEQHDSARSKNGSFEKIKNTYHAVSPLREKFSNLVLDANSVYTAESEGHIKQTMEYLHRNYDFNNLSVTYARGEIKEDHLKDVSFDNYIELNRYLESIERKKEKRSLYSVWRGVRDLSRENLIKTVFQDEYVTPCVAGRKLVVIDEVGEVYPCEILGKSMGNLADYNFNIKELLSEKANDDLVNWIVDTKCKCSFECALTANVVWNMSSYPKLVKATLKNIGRQ